LEKPKKKKFLNTPKYPGGSQAFRAFIVENLRYPDQALQLGVQGSVIVGYDVFDTGEVSNIHIIKGLGHGCDEEAMRLIGLLSFEKVRNRGLRLRMSSKTTIHFRLPGMVINYTSTSQPASKDKDNPTDSGQGSESYNYTITF
jgi:TonB family protein